MEEKKRKNPEEKNRPRALNYEDILDGFVLEEGKGPVSTGASRTDLDGLALAELLGDTGGDSATDVAASGHFDAIGASDYSELARRFDELDLSELIDGGPEKDMRKNAAAPVEEAADDDLPEPVPDLKLDDDELSLEDSAGYAALLDRLEAEGKMVQPAEAIPEPPAAETTSSGEQPEPEPVDWELLFEPEPEAVSDATPEAPAKTEVLSFVNLAESRDASPSEPPAVESAAAPAPEPAPARAEELDLSELFAGAAETSVMQAQPVPTPDKAAPALAETTAVGTDFLGLTALSPRENRAPGKPARKMEVLFEGVEMSFEDQTDEVTLAELLLAQGKRKDAAEIFQRVSQNRGTTFWVAKRLRSFAASAE